MHNPPTPGGYEWSYVDGISDDGAWGFVAIWFRGCPMSPYYCAAIDRATRRGTPLPNPSDYPAFSFSLYHHGRRVYFALHEEPAAAWSGSASAPDVRVGANTLHGNTRLDEKVYLLNVDTAMPWQRSRVVGDIEMTSAAVDLPFDSESLPVDQPAHAWIPAAPDGVCTVRLDLWQRFGGTTKIRCRGRAYHDRNVGTEPLHRISGDWHWGRVHDGERTLLYLSITPDTELATEQRFRRLLLLDGGQLVAEANNFLCTPEPAPMHWSTLPQRTNLLCVSDESGIVVRSQTQKKLDSGPFYHRTLSTIEATLDGIPWCSGTGIAEYLRPSRLGVAAFRPFVAFRVRRRR